MNINQEELAKLTEMLVAHQQKHGIASIKHDATNCQGCFTSCSGSCRTGCSGSCSGFCTGTSKCIGLAR